MFHLERVVLTTCSENSMKVNGEKIALAAVMYTFKRHKSGMKYTGLLLIFN